MKQASLHLCKSHFTLGGRCRFKAPKEACRHVETVTVCVSCLTNDCRCFRLCDIVAGQDTLAPKWLTFCKWSGHTERRDSGCALVASFWGCCVFLRVAHCSASRGYRTVCTLSCPSSVDWSASPVRRASSWMYVLCFTLQSVELGGHRWSRPRMMYTITRGPSKLVTQRRTGETVGLNYEARHTGKPTFTSPNCW